MIKFNIFLTSKQSQLRILFKHKRFFDLNPMMTHEAALIPMNTNNKSALIYSNNKPVKPMEIAVVPITDICIMEKTLPLKRSEIDF